MHSHSGHEHDLCRWYKAQKITQWWAAKHSSDYSGVVSPANYSNEISILDDYHTMYSTTGVCPSHYYYCIHGTWYCTPKWERLGLFLYTCTELCGQSVQSLDCPLNNPWCMHGVTLFVYACVCMCVCHHTILYLVHIHVHVESRVPLDKFCINRFNLWICFVQEIWCCLLTTTTIDTFCWQQTHQQF